MKSGQRTDFPTECCFLEEEWKEKGLEEVEGVVESALLKYQDASNRLMRQTALSQVEMVTRLLLLEAKELQAKMNEKFKEMYEAEMDRIGQLEAML